VLSLTGRHCLTGRAFDLAADLVDVLPGLCAAIRDRQTLTLLAECQHLLHQADLASPREPLDAARLREYVVPLCRSVATVLDCAEAAVSLSRAAGCDAAPLSASATAPPAGSPPAGFPPAGSPPAVTGGTVTRELVSGQQVWGRLECGGPRQPPF